VEIRSQVDLLKFLGNLKWSEKLTAPGASSSRLLEGKLLVEIGGKRGGT
jgi:hypothetical protein